MLLLWAYLVTNFKIFNKCIHLNFTFNNQNRNAFICNLLVTHRWICISLTGCTASTRFFFSCSKVVKLIYFGVVRGHSKITRFFFFFIPKHYFSIGFLCKRARWTFLTVATRVICSVSRMAQRSKNVTLKSKEVLL